MTDFLPLLATALIAGLLGSAHCLAMCAGISGMVAINAGIMALSTQLPLTVAYNAGRILSYAALGAVVATFGDTVVTAIPALAGPLRLAAGVVIVLIGLQVAFDLKLLAPFERLGLGLWQRISRLAGRMLPISSLPRALGLGLLWGLIPCGLVYSVLLLAATSANPATGAASMLVFGIGTLPAMLMTGVGAFRLSQTFGRARRTAGILIIVLGLLTLMLPVQSLLSNDAAGHEGHAQMQADEAHREPQT